MKKTKPVVTIITATYNLIEQGRKDFFLQNIESVKNQTYDNIEHLIIDGGSTDGTLDLIKSTGLKYISEPDKGIYDAFNKGIRIAKGKYINFLNSDDYFNNVRAVELSVNALEKANADFSFANTDIVNLNNDFIRKFNHNIDSFLVKMPFCHQTMFTKKDVLEKENYFNMEYKSASDYEFIIKIMLKKYDYVSIDETIVSFRLDGESSINQDLSISEQIKIFYKTYLSYKKLSKKDLINIFIKNTLPLELIFKLPIDISARKYLIKSKIISLKKDLIRFRITKKRILYFRILGFTIIDNYINDLKKLLCRLTVWNEINL